MGRVHRIIIRRRRPGVVSDVRRGTLAIGLRRVLVAPDALEDMRRHVNEMTRRRHHRPHPFRRG